MTTGGQNAERDDMKRKEMGGEGGHWWTIALSDERKLCSVCGEVKRSEGE